MADLWVRFRHGEATGFGLLDGERIHVHAGDMFEAPRSTGEVVSLADARLLAPVVPGAFIGLWNNFFEAAAKQGNAIPTEPLWFLKSPRSFAGPGDPIRPPSGYTGRVLYEGELGLVIGRSCKDLDEAEAQGAIFGITCVNDVTALDLLIADPSFPQWARAKGCDGFGPIGPAIATGLDWSSLRVKTALNGRVRQDYPLSDMILPPARIVSLISREMTLHAGDVIACGTSLGALPMRPGMLVEVSIKGIGVLANPYG
ncbi:2-keto-4-pentenoate hydratase/2-oxohepta-3-ene-1,7-dioic acid hydratase in catechol pathway [Humitalea rosea]|uniref:2-keto-4-pentenoate hydratase/2-oxohepta-3-ene-1,7-dioic acid hydratase in catechol pathway n=1 Tax=Humitalea rosea TaxID=990373 RepID=A0A2W7II02_9PROT|nr:fumarylacetoacetate hydrolase family protein [Humitalea rosea]PZW38947.1 2-keto-4-pentenoate hydratase/2-oxohepta-3-ene-1,7-dioic acid hydratase in catechol pathway [Humitalea rosea]